jgi:hypothetical protein
MVTMLPLLWLARQRLLALHTRKSVAWPIAIACSSLSSITLMGPFTAVQSPIVSWLSALAAAASLATCLRPKATSVEAADQSDA